MTPLEQKKADHIDDKYTSDEWRFFDDWFHTLLLLENQSALIRDVLRNSKEKLWEEWKKAKPYG